MDNNDTHLKNIPKERLTRREKNAKDKQWYKDHADILDVQYYDTNNLYGVNLDRRRMRIAYDLFNNILHMEDLDYVCKPFGVNSGKLPARMANRDISSSKIKHILGLENSREFKWKFVAVNPEATTRKEEFEFGRMKDLVINNIMAPIRAEVEASYQQQLKGRELTQQELGQIQQQIEQQIEQMTPESVKKYASREHQDPAEIQSNQLMRVLLKKLDMFRKFSECFKHGTLSAVQAMYIGIFNGQPDAFVINPMRFYYESTDETIFIEDGERCSYEYRFNPYEVIQLFGDELTDEEIDHIYEHCSSYGNLEDEGDLFAIHQIDRELNRSYVPVIHCCWKALRKIGFLTYIDENGQTQTEYVDEDYELDTDNGDISIEWDWIVETYETWKIKTGKPIYLKMRPVPGQVKDSEDLYVAKLPYYGIVYDNMNSLKTSIMDRLVPYQYFFDIIMYRLELLLASDKGKKAFVNINAVPSSSNMDLSKFQYFLESTPYGWMDPTEEGVDYGDINSLVKVVDLSLASDISKYIEIAEYIRQQAGKSIGIPDSVEGQISSRDAVGNVQQALIQSSYILEPYFKLHNIFKRNVIKALLETAKVAYHGRDDISLSYVLDDMSVEMLKLDVGLLDSSTLGLYVTDSPETEEVKNTIRAYTQAALQNQQVELSSAIAILRQDGVLEAEETLELAEEKRRQAEQQRLEQERAVLREEQQAARDLERQKFEQEKELTILKEEERRKTEIIKAGFMGASFNPDQDRDSDGQNDFIEAANKEVENQIKISQQQLEREKFEHQKYVDKEKIKIDKKKTDKK